MHPPNCLNVQRINLQIFNPYRYFSRYSLPESICKFSIPIVTLVGIRCLNLQIDSFCETSYIRCHISCSDPKHHTAVEVPQKWAERTVKSNANVEALTPSYVIDFPAPVIECEYVIERSVGQAEQDDVDLIWISESDRIELDDPKSWMPWDGQCDDFDHEVGDA